jgi:hypothetical protein
MSILEVVFIIALAFIPLFAAFPYRVNIFLSWEGAYRISQGQLPFRDFGSPLGGMYWVIPGIFFKIFGPQMISLIKAQVLINILAGLSFRSILKSLSVQESIRFLSVILFCLSYSFFNFWPWYNHSVIVYELIAIAFLLRYITGQQVSKKRHLYLAASAIFVCFSFLTKQDGGGMAFILCLMLLTFDCFVQKNWRPVLFFVGYFGLVIGTFILVFSQYGLSYWFNYGQPPHSARISVLELANEFFYSSQWIKFYLFLVILLSIIRFTSWKEFIDSKKEGLFLILTLGVLGEAAIFQVTSYTPPDNNIFFHSFAFAFIITLIAQLTSQNFFKPKIVIVCFVGMILWWSGTYWKYINRIIDRIAPEKEILVSATGENIVNRKTFMINSADTLDVPMDKWVYTGLKSLEKVYMPKPTADGIQRLLNMEIVKSKRNLNVLNMSELTSLAVEIPYELEKDERYPLWHHLGVGMFNREAEMFEKRIGDQHYDLVLFEYIPTLNNFYPFRVRDSLNVHYQKVDSFLAPRRGTTLGNIEVYIKKR